MYVEKTESDLNSYEDTIREWKDKAKAWEMLAIAHRDDIKYYWIPLVNKLKQKEMQ